MCTEWSKLMALGGMCSGSLFLFYGLRQGSGVNLIMQASHYRFSSSLPLIAPSNWGMGSSILPALNTGINHAWSDGYLADASSLCSWSWRRAISNSNCASLLLQLTSINTWFLSKTCKSLALFHFLYLKTPSSALLHIYSLCLVEPEACTDGHWAAPLQHLETLPTLTLNSTKKGNGASHLFDNKTGVSSRDPNNLNFLIFLLLCV